MGLERLLMLAEASGKEFREEKVDLYICTMGESAYDKIFPIALELRRKGLKVEIDHMSRSVKSQFKYADKISAKFVATIGDSELESGKVALKEMVTGNVEEVELSVQGILTKFSL